LEANMTGVTDQSQKGADVIFQHPTISLIETALEPGAFSLYIGGTDAARDVALLREHNVSIVVNCAVNLDINYVSDPNEPAEGEKCAHGTGPVRTFKLGLVDGPGNSEYMMLAGYLLLDGAVRQILPDRTSYPQRRQGNVLVHCRGGRSRSTVLVALYLHLSRPDKFPSLDLAIAHVREKRELHPDEWFSAPKPVLIEAARRAADIVRQLNARDGNEA
jgi:hypothetical protein